MSTRKRRVRRRLSQDVDTTDLSACFETNSGNAVTQIIHNDADISAKQQVKRNLSQAANVTVIGTIQLESECSATNVGNAVVQKSHTDAAEANTVTKRRRTCSLWLSNDNCQSVETSSDSVTTITFTADRREVDVSDSGVNSNSSHRLGKSSCAETVVVRNSSSVPVVEHFTNADAAATAAMAACDVVIHKLSSASALCKAGDKTLVDGHNVQAGTKSRGKRNRCRAADNDVEPVEAASTDNHSASCKY